MIGILFTAVLSSSTGQLPGPNPMDNNMQMLIQNGSYQYAPGGGMPYSGMPYSGGQTAFQGGLSSASTMSCNVQLQNPCWNRGCYCAMLGTTIGPYPAASVGRLVATPCAMQYMPGPYGGGYPGMGGMGSLPPRHGGGMGGFPGMGGAMMGAPIILPPATAWSPIRTMPRNPPVPRSTRKSREASKTSRIRSNGTSRATSRS